MYSKKNQGLTLLTNCNCVVIKKFNQFYKGFYFVRARIN